MMRTARPEKLLTYSEAAAVLAVSTRKLKYLVASGDIRAVIVGERNIRIRTSDLERYIAKLPAKE